MRPSPPLAGESGRGGAACSVLVARAPSLPSPASGGGAQAPCVWQARSPRQREHTIEIDALGEMRGQPIERVLDLGLVRNRRRARAEPREPGRALAIIREQPV